MATPIIADNKPVGVELEAGKEYYFCRCGLSKKQPFCDGSHAGSGITPQAFTAKADGEAYLCACKQSGNQPYCDGSHKQFSADMVGKAPEPEPASVHEPDKASVTGPAVQATPEEPTVAAIHQLAKQGLNSKHGAMVSMGVPRSQLPDWNDIQVMVAQLATKPLQDGSEVGTRLVIGPEAKKPLELAIPLFVSDMSFGALSQEAKVAMAKGAELAGTGICSGEGGMLAEEQAANSRYFYELASAQFGYQETLLKQVQAFHFKGGQAAKTGTGGHLPGNKVTEKIAKTRGLNVGEAAISPATFTDLHSVKDFERFAGRVREITGGIPVGFKLSANRIEADVQFALDAGADYIILDGRGGGTGAAPEIFRDHISVPTIPALARARRYLDQQGASGKVTLIVTGGLRMPMDFVKALALGADGVALANSAMQAIGCVAARMCNSNQCPSGIATQDPELRKLLDVDVAAANLQRYLQSSVQLMQVMARACGHDSLSQFELADIATWHRDLAKLAGIPYSGVSVD
ncbi:glutamate synthase-related protein [Aliagarivorans taiwanensis]|uniref:glutamate synthase-related protein n=1 Tax=Aliagarivorans taiwanensis TaxID=561966 RepID=UPI00041C2EFE|nr:glutamate synthase-related protein [Aliagarivorans taiwanensis]